MCGRLRVKDDVRGPPDGGLILATVMKDKAREIISADCAAGLDRLWPSATESAARDRR